MKFVPNKNPTSSTEILIFIYCA